jgi:hypothetical protein
VLIPTKPGGRVTPTVELLVDMIITIVKFILEVGKLIPTRTETMELF